MDNSFVEQNKASRKRLKKLVKGLSKKDMGRKVGADWTVAVALAHIAFWDRRVQFTLDKTEAAGKLVVVEFEDPLNDVILPTWELVPGRKAAKLAIETADELDKQLASFPPELLEQVYAHNPRWVVRALHRNEHLDEVDKALQG